jgi:agmatine deiminase
MPGAGAGNRPARRMPAEWEPHDATWLCWPHNPQTWPGCLDAAQAEYTDLVAALARFERAEVLVQSAEHDAEVRARLDRAGVRNARLHVVPSNDSWMRDIGPTFVHEHGGGAQHLLAIDWIFNSWGGKYAPWEDDDAVASAVARIAGVPSERSVLTLEGGALEVDGTGTLISTRSSVLDPARNPGRSREQIESELRAQLGVREILWVDGALPGDDTDGHVDQLVRFVAPGRVVCTRASDPALPSAAPLEELRKQLESSRDARGRNLEVIVLPLARPIETPEGYLPASPMNFLIVNGGVLVPVFDAPESDEVALRRFAQLFPGREIVPIPSRNLARGLGSVHCLSQQQPR